MERPTSSTSQLIHLAWQVLFAQLAWMANAVIDTAMAVREADYGRAYTIPFGLILRLRSGLKAVRRH